MFRTSVLKIGTVAAALCFAVPGMAQMTDQTTPMPAAGVYPPCSSTVMDQCTNTRRESDTKASMGGMDSMAMPMHRKHHMKKHMHRHHRHHKM